MKSRHEIIALVPLHDYWRNQCKYRLGTFYTLDDSGTRKGTLVKIRLKRKQIVELTYLNKE